MRKITKKFMVLSNDLNYYMIRRAGLPWEGYECFVWYNIDNCVIYDTIYDALVKPFNCMCILDNYKIINDIYEVDVRDSISYDNMIEVKIIKKVSDDVILKELEKNIHNFIEDSIKLFGNYNGLICYCKMIFSRFASKSEIIANELTYYDNGFIRKLAAYCGYGLNILINDRETDVRAAVASKGYGLYKLIKDEKWAVREEVARQGYGLDILVNDKDENVRFQVAVKGYKLDVLINDDSKWIRRLIAKKGYRLDILINDKDNDVRLAALETLVKQNEALLGVKLEMRED